MQYQVQLLDYPGAVNRFLGFTFNTTELTYLVWRHFIALLFPTYDVFDLEHTWIDHILMMHWLRSLHSSIILPQTEFTVIVRRPALTEPN
jgi:hypothetical protein